MVECAVLLAAMLVTLTGAELTDKEYYLMPPLYQLDNLEECLTHRRAAFCVGTFELMQYKNDKLLTIIQQYSSNTHHFNHSRIDRGYCLATTCSHIEGILPHQKFQRCVSSLTKINYGLETNLTELQYCRTRKERKKVDAWDVSFAYVIGTILVLNLFGTTYDLLRREDKQPYKPLLAWSLLINWRILTADHSVGNPRMGALRPINAIKVLILVLVMLAHTVYAYHFSYLYNPRFFETGGKSFLSAYFQSGSVIVQIFILISCFLLTYKLLISCGDKNPLSIKMLPECFIHRIIRISPLYLFILGVASSWWFHMGSGPLWAPLVGRQVATCRAKWWANALYINNVVKLGDTCLGFTWFLAVDMQMYVFCACLVVALGRRPRSAVWILLTVLLGSLVFNFIIIHNWQLLPMMKLTVAETMRRKFAGEASFQWLYQGPWGSVPTALIGIITAFIYYNKQTDNYRPDMRIRMLYRLSLACICLWPIFGYFMKRVTNTWLLSLYTTIERPGFVALAAIVIFAFFYKIDMVLWQVLSWRVWEVLSRMSLSIYLVHWLLSLTITASRITTTTASFFDVIQHWLATIVLSHCAAFFLYMFIEVPAMKFLQALISFK